MWAKTSGEAMCAGQLAQVPVVPGRLDAAEHAPACRPLAVPADAEAVAVRRRPRRAGSAGSGRSASARACRAAPRGGPAIPSRRASDTQLSAASRRRASRSSCGSGDSQQAFPPSWTMPSYRLAPTISVMPARLAKQAQMRDNPATVREAAKDMVWVEAATFLMGSDAFYPEERPGPARSEVGGFWIDAHPVTVAEFRRFVRATGYVTVAERPPDPADYPDADPALLVPGSLVFRPPRGPVACDDYRSWWAYVPGRVLARSPRGRAATIYGARRATPSSTSPTRTPRRTPPGPARRCRPRPSGSTPRAAASTAPRSPGATRTSRTGSDGQHAGRASSPGRTCAPTATRAPRRSARSRPTATASTT